MKKIILFALIALMVVGCGCETDTETEEQKGFDIIVVDSCEYLKKIESDPNLGYGFMAHKGNCCFCKERKQKELEELVIKLKEK